MEAEPSGPRRPRPWRRHRITDSDHELLAFLAEHRIVDADHVRALLGTSRQAAQARLRALSGAGLVAQERVFHRRPACYLITRAGLVLLGSDLPPPRVDLRCYEHDLGLAWLWLAARAGTFGPMREVIAERSLRSADGTLGQHESLAGPSERLAVRLGGFGPAGRERLHYPDLLLVTPEGKRIAVELELSRKGRTRREKIIAGYRADQRTDAVLYLVPDRALGLEIAGIARRLGVSDLVHVQLVRRSQAASVPGGAAARSAARGRDTSTDRSGPETGHAGR